MEGISPDWPPPAPLAGQTPPLEERKGWPPLLGADSEEAGSTGNPVPPPTAPFPSRGPSATPAYPGAPQRPHSTWACPGDHLHASATAPYLAQRSRLASPPPPSGVAHRPAGSCSVPQRRPCREAGGRRAALGPLPVPPSPPCAPAAALPRLHARRPREGPRPAVPAAAAPPPPEPGPPAPRSQARARLPRRAGGDRDARPLTSPESRRRRQTQPLQWG